MKQYIFLDVDGTICDFGGSVPQSTKEAICLARKKGHKVFLCTGRARCEISEEILTIGFDGVIASAGAYVEYEGNMIQHKPMEAELIKEIAEFFDKKEIGYIFEGNDSICTNKKSIQRVERFISKTAAIKDALSKIIPAIKEIKPGDVCTDINKISFFDAGCEIDSIKQKFSDRCTIIPSSLGYISDSSGEISSKTMNKAVGIQAICQMLHVEKEATMAFGDSENDREMIAFVQKGIAMGNAREELKSIADDVTDTVRSNGIWKSFIKYKLIQE